MAVTGLPEADASGPPKRSLLREMLEGSGLYSLAMVGQRIASMILMPVYTRYLGPADYGTLDLADQAVGVLALLFGSSFSSALFYFYFLQPDREWRTKAAATNIVGSALAGLCAAVAGVLLAPQISQVVFRTAEMAPFFRLLFATTALSFMIEALLCWLRAENMAPMFAGFSLAKLALVITFSCILLIVFHMTVAGVLLSNLLSNLILTVALGAYCFRRIGVDFEVRLFWRMMKFSFPLAISGIAFFIMHFADRFILQRYISLSDLGIYSLAYKIGMMISFIHASFHTYWSSQVYEILRREDAGRLFARVFTYMMTVLSFCALGLIVTTKPAVTLLATKQYEGAVFIVPFIVGAYYVRAIGDFFRLLFAVHNRLGLDAVCNWIGAAFCLAAYFLLIPRYGVYGAAIATVLTFVAVAAVAYFAACRLMVFHLEAGRLLKLAATTVGLAAIHFYVSANTFLSQTLLALVLLIHFPVLLWFMGFLSKPETERFRSLAQTVKHRLLG